MPSPTEVTKKRKNYVSKSSLLLSLHSSDNLTVEARCEKKCKSRAAVELVIGHKAQVLYDLMLLKRQYV